MSEPFEVFNNYYIHTEDVGELKRHLGSLAAEYAEVDLTVSGPEDGGTTRKVTFRVSETRGEGQFISRGVVVKPLAEASIRALRTESGTEYLVMAAELDSTTDEPEPAHNAH